MTSRRKQLEVLDAFPLPSGQNECIAQISQNRGNALFEAILSSQPNVPVLVQLPPKFRGSVFVKRGNYVIVELFSEVTSKIVADIKHILFPKQVKHIMKEGLWPKVFFQDVHANEKSIDLPSSGDDTSCSEDALP